MTAPEDPFRTPPPGQEPAGGGQPPYGSQQYGSSQYGSPQYGSPQYGSQPYGEPAYGEQRPPPRNGLGIAALVLGVLALLTGFFVIGGVLGIAAIVLGVLGRGRAKRGEATNGGMAIAGIVLGVLGLLLTALVVAGVASVFDEVSNLTDCLESAGGDPVAEQQCQTDFEDDFTS